MSTPDELDEVKVVLIGGGGSGKSCITNYFLTGLFTSDYDPTIEDSYVKKFEVDGEPVVLDILDTAGQEEYTAMLNQYLKSGQGFILVYAVNDRDSFNDVLKFRNRLWAARDKVFDETIPLILVGNKCDLEKERVIKYEEGQELATSFKCIFIETSAKTGKGVHEVFNQVVKEVRRDRKAKGYVLKKTKPPGEDMKKKLLRKFSKWGFLGKFFGKKDKDKHKEPKNLTVITPSSSPKIQSNIVESQESKVSTPFSVHTPFNYQEQGSNNSPSPKLVPIKSVTSNQNLANSNSQSPSPPQKQSPPPPPPLQKQTQPPPPPLQKQTNLFVPPPYHQPLPPKTDDVYGPMKPISPNQSPRSSTSINSKSEFRPQSVNLSAMPSPQEVKMATFHEENDYVEEVIQKINQQGESDDIANIQRDLDSWLKELDDTSTKVEGEMKTQTKSPQIQQKSQVTEPIQTNESVISSIVEMAIMAPLPPPILLDIPPIMDIPPITQTPIQTQSKVIVQPNQGGKDFYGKVPKKVDPLAKLAEYPWFHGTISSSEADSKLLNQPIGTFLFRFSSQNGFLAASYVDTSGVQRCLVAFDGDSFWMTDESTTTPERYPSLDALVQGFKTVFTKPFNKIATSKPPDMYSKIPTVQPHKRTGTASERNLLHK